jgi:outer membrane protein OmpA-like peptidoglycan-associated protein
MRRAVVIIALAVASAAGAEPVHIEVQSAVPIGQKPQIKLNAEQDVTDVRVELERGDGKHFTLKQPSLAKGRTVTLAIGDGAAGKVSYKATVSAQIVGGGKWSNDIQFDTTVAAALRIGYDADHLDLDKHVLQFKPSRPVSDAALVVLGEDGSELGKGAAIYTSDAADAWLAITWTQASGARVMKMKLHVTASDGGATNLELIPWSVTIDHEDVSFSTDSAVIEASEAPKLDASLAKIADIVKTSGRFMKMTLYVAGHTDTVGPAAKNRKLSVARALAIATYFRKHGLTIAIAAAGFGEDVLKVKTPDETDERANRRADYVLGPTGGTPPFKGAYLQAHAEWKTVR